MPLVALEALAVGLPVFATAVGGIRELLDEFGCGVLLPEDAPDSTVARMIVNALDDSNATMERIARGREAIDQRYRPDIAFRPVAENYELLTRAREARRRTS